MNSSVKAFLLFSLILPTVFGSKYCENIHRKNPTKIAICKAQILADNVLLPKRLRRAYRSEPDLAYELKEDLADYKEISDDALSKAFKIKIDDTHECFSDKGKRLVDRDLRSQDRVEALEDMVRSAAIFLKKYYLDTKGNPSDWFGIKKVSICALDYEKENLPFKMVYRSSKVLQLYLSYKQERHMCYLWRAYDYVQCTPDSQDILTMWNKGMHLDYAVDEKQSFLPSFLTAKSSGIKLEKLLRDNWSMLNPAGFFAPKVREYLLPAVKKLSEKVKGILANKEDNEDLASEFADAIYPNINHEQFANRNGQPFEALLRDLPRNKIEKLMKEFVVNINDPKEQNNLIRSMFASTATQVETKFENEQDGPINIANIHDINVLITFGAPVGDYANYVKVIDRNITIKNKQGNSNSRPAADVKIKGKVGTMDGSVLFGAGKVGGSAIDGEIQAKAEVNVFTVDLISVSAQIVIDRALETVTLERLLNGIKR